MPTGNDCDLRQTAKIMHPLKILEGAGLESVTFNGAQRLTLLLSPLVWRGQQGYFEGTVALDMIGVYDLPRVVGQLLLEPNLELNYAEIRVGNQTKSGPIQIELVSERTDLRCQIRCQKAYLDGHEFERSGGAAVSISAISTTPKET